MPLGTRHELIGILLGGDPYTVLSVADGGEWRLDCPRSCRHLIGQKVRVVGTRSDFDMLDVERIEPA